jgi:hypothetical protein
MENRTTVLLFSNGHWFWSEHYHHDIHKSLGKYVEVYFAKGWHDTDVNEVIQEYYATNSGHLFEDNDQ